MTPVPAPAVDKNTKITLGILLTLVAATASGSIYLGSISAALKSMDRSLLEVKSALDRNTAQIVANGKTQAVLETRTTELDRRIQRLESAK